MDVVSFIMAVESGEISDPHEIREGLIEHQSVILQLQGFWQRLYRDLVIDWDGESQ